MNSIHKILSAGLLTLLLGTMFLSLFHMSVGMDMHGAMGDCPFMSHGEALCPMNLADHIGVWKSVFLSIVPSLTVLFAIAGMAVGLASVAPNLLQPWRYISPPLLKTIRERIYTFSYRPLQELFSNGILHPKLF